MVDQLTEYFGLCFVEDPPDRSTIDDLIALEMFQSSPKVSEETVRVEMKVVEKLVELREKHKTEYKANGALPDLDLESTSEESESDDDDSDDDSDEAGQSDEGDCDSESGKNKKKQRGKANKAEDGGDEEEGADDSTDEEGEEESDEEDDSENNGE